MRIGSVYVPLDLRNPLPRLAAVAVDCQPAAILADGDTAVDAQQLCSGGMQAAIINVSKLPEKPAAPVANVARPESPAAILYTSGSTGTPKGIVITHSGLRNEIEGYTKTWGLGAENVLQQSAFTFNHSSDQIYTGLVNGGSVYIVSSAKRGDPLEITKIVREHKITYTKATPAEYLLWLEHGMDNLRLASNWRFAFGGGEQLTSTVTSAFANLDLPQLKFFNSYGPAEISISSTKMEVDYRSDLSAVHLPCGYQLPNYVAYVLDDSLKPVPAGMPGEIVLGGAGVAIGYLGNEQLTKSQFIPNPYAPSDWVSYGWDRMYRTGDIGHLQDDGALVFHNRIAGDTQVKIRGLRIELSDIESNISRASNGALREVVVTLRDGKPDFLVAHVVFSSNNKVTDRESFLKTLLEHLPVPQYMVPVLAVPIDRLPLSNHSKVDRKAVKQLPLPAREPSSNKEDTDELSEVMMQLKDLWQDVLGNKELGFNIGSTTSFFSVGGNSLLIVRLQSRIRDTFDVVVRLVELLESNTLGEMARKIEEGLSVEKLEWKEEIKLPTNLPQVSSARRPAAQAKTVIVTGATGFLGNYVLRLLNEDTHVGKIHCLAVRDRPADSTRKITLSSPKLAIHPGSFSQPLFGLEQSQFEALSDQADVILHLGAVRSFWDNYHVLRPSNVTPTKELVRLAAKHKVPIHYISSAGVVSPKYLESGLPAGSVAANRPPEDGSNGYVASRWASEQILERAQAQLGIPVMIHRFVSASKPTKGTEQAVLEDFVRYIDKTKLMPELGGWKGSFDMMPAQSAAQALCEGILAEATCEDAERTQFRHHECGIRIDVEEMRSFVEQHRGSKNLERMPGLRWVGRIKPLGFGYFFASQDVVLEGGADGDAKETLQSRR